MCTAYEFSRKERVTAVRTTVKLNLNSIIFLNLLTCKHSHLARSSPDVSLNDASKKKACHISIHVCSLCNVSFLLCSSTTTDTADNLTESAHREYELVDISFFVHPTYSHRRLLSFVVVRRGHPRGNQLRMPSNTSQVIVVERLPTRFLNPFLCDSHHSLGPAAPLLPCGRRPVRHTTLSNTLPFNPPFPQKTFVFQKPSDFLRVFLLCFRSPIVSAVCIHSQSELSSPVARVRGSQTVARCLPADLRECGTLPCSNSFCCLRMRAPLFAKWR